MKLSIVIPVHNDEEQLNETLRLIHKFTPPTANYEIFVVDDASEIPYSPRGPVGKINLCRFNVNRGPAAAREYGSSMATGDWLLHTDSHMVFHEDWFPKLFTHVEREGEDTLLCGTYVTVHKTDKQILNVGGGARMNFYERGAEQTRMLELEPTIEEVALAGRSPDQVSIGAAYRVPCSVGAFYCFNRQNYNRLKGLVGLNGWGCEEILMSLKYYLAGGVVKVMPDLRVGHIWQHQVVGFHTVDLLSRPAEWRVLYNKLVTLWYTCGEDICYDFLQYVRHPYAARAKEELADKREDHQRLRKQLDGSVYVRDIDWYCNEFGIDHPADIKVAFLQ